MLRSCYAETIFLCIHSSFVFHSTILGSYLRLTVEQKRQLTVSTYGDIYLVLVLFGYYHNSVSDLLLPKGLRDPLHQVFGGSV